MEIDPFQLAAEQAGRAERGIPGGAVARCHRFSFPVVTFPLRACRLNMDGM